MRTNALALMMNNQPFLGRNFFMSPGAVNHDGMLDICLIENSTSLAETLAVIVKVLTGRHIFAKGVKIWQTREVRLQTERLMDFMGDGEIGQQAKEFKVEVLPQAVNVITARSKEN
jgi:diacylglycerol kinase family enzyme